MYVLSKQGRSLPELEQLEKDLRKALEGVCGERDRIVQEQLAKEEQRLCVVCQVGLLHSAVHQLHRRCGLNMVPGEPAPPMNEWFGTAL